VNVLLAPLPQLLTALLLTLARTPIVMTGKRPVVQ